ncbi:MAG: YncE family protein [Chitinophagaceae bacterium]|nr:MAG: YncE family protein [Chitinophagaceae bacterium]
MKTAQILFLSLITTMVISSCSKDDNEPGENPKVTTGVFTLSEGPFGQAATTLTFYNPVTNTASTDFYENANNSSLESLGNDMIIYGSKMYIVVNVGSSLTVADAKTAKLIQNIPFETPGGDKLEPRYVVPYKGKVLVSSWDGTVAVIDTVSLTISKFITVGANPEQMAVVGDKLYVANSGGLQAVMDSTVSVVDLISMSETSKIVVGVNPNYIVADNNGSIYVASTGNYWDIGPKLTKINTANNTITKVADTAVAKMAFHDGLLYTTGGYLGSQFVRTLNTTDFAATSPNFVTDGTAITQAYGITVDPQNNDVYVTDAKNFMGSGEVFCFDKNGKKKFSFPVAPGIGPNTVILVK